MRVSACFGEGSTEAGLTRLGPSIDTELGNSRVQRGARLINPYPTPATPARRPA